MSISDCLNAKFEGIQRKGQNSTDKGELCELFIKDFLDDFFVDNFKIFRGGKIVNIENLESKQIDIVLAAKNTIKIFSDKGIYPIESVFGVFSITATLDHPKLLGCIEELKSIPRQNAQFLFYFINEQENMEIWYKRFPYKCIFGFTGDINLEWENELNKMVGQNNSEKNYLPDLIVINKKGMIQKVYNKPQPLLGGGETNKDFHFTDFKLITNYGTYISSILNELYVLSGWQFYMAPKYYKYFNRDDE